ncbi:siderophore-interacting protein [Auraticoccus monumenti]|uniref:NADPH-dependent ferric siderophore reductase, contains FAD-binding and SIP domains n=1 Tax=Auraticoccus monumenti TaxID=675864 RepID=A0A1G6S9G2_9ACTN|nr:siderophore-interacting protein [Auraticoccus monumenti]SDD13580.1 NADPH-dependent ferric siderophore reductase, contains FAD-binding and SIP domains [Auraticoccus monumenti]
MTLTTTPVRTATYRPFAVRLVARQQLSPGFLRLTFTGADLGECGTTCLDQRVKLVLADQEQVATALASGEDWYGWWLALDDDRRPPMRTYTVRAVRPELAEVDVDFACHGTEGPASAFAVDAPIGSPLLLVGPDAGVPGSDEVGFAWRPGTATEVVLVGDETAVPAICGIMERLPGHVTGRVLLEVPTDADALDLVAPAGVGVTWLARDGRPHGEVLEQAVREWAGVALPQPVAPVGEVAEVAPEDVLWEEADAAGGRYVWVAGEAGLVATIRRHLVKERGLDRHSASFMGYWRAGRAG